MSSIKNLNITVMNNSIFMNRCETLVITMRSSDLKQVTNRQIANWLEIAEGASAQFVAKVCKLGILQKVGGGYNTKYQLSVTCHNSIQSEMTAKGNVITSAIPAVVKWFMNRPNTKVQAKELTTETGRKFVHVQSSEELDAVSKQAIDQILTIINQNKELKAEVELLREEIERLKPYEEKYNQIRQLTK